MTHEQQYTIDRFVRDHGRVQVDDRQPGNIRVTVPTGGEYRIADDGVPARLGVNFSVNWRYNDVPACEIHGVADCPKINCQLTYAREGY